MRLILVFLFQRMYGCMDKPLLVGFSPQIHPRVRVSPAVFLSRTIGDPRGCSGGVVGKRRSRAESECTGVSHNGPFQSLEIPLSLDLP